MPRIVYIQSTETGMAVSIDGGRTDQGAKLVMWPFHDGKNQLWTLEGNRIRSMNCSHVMDLEGPSNEGSHVIIHPEHGGSNQQWCIESDGTIHNGTGLVLDVQSANRNPGAHLIGWRHHGGGNQKFRVVVYSSSECTPTCGTRNVYIQNVETNLVLDIKDASKEEGTRLIMWPFEGSSNQLWKIDGHNIRSHHNDHVLDLAGPSNEGAHVIVYRHHGGTNQQWHIESDGTIRNGTGYVLDVQGGSTEQGAHVIGWSKNCNANQKFRIVEYFG